MLVTGATGFIGAHVVHELSRAGHEVRTVGRRALSLVGPDVEQFVLPDLTDMLALKPALAGTDWVIHVAGLAHVTRDSSKDLLAEYRRVNAEMTRALAEAAAASGASAFVLLSSAAVLENQSEGAGAAERRRSAYSRSKREAEEVLIEIASHSRMRPVIVRAPMVYGPNMEGNPLRLFRLIERGIPLPFAGLDNLRSSVYVGNLAAAIRHSLEEPSVRGVVHVADTELFSTAGFIRLSAEGLGVKPRLFRFPIPVLKVMGKVGDLANRILPFPVTSEAVDRLTASMVLDTRAPYALSGFRPPFTAAAGIRITSQWFMQRGKLRPRA